MLAREIIERDKMYNLKRGKNHEELIQLGAKNIGIEVCG